MSDLLRTRGGAVRTRDTADIQQAYMAALALAHEVSCHSSLSAVHHELTCERVRISKAELRPFCEKGSLYHEAELTRQGGEAFIFSLVL